MTDEEVRSFFKKELSEKPLCSAYATTGRQIGLDLLNKYLDPATDPSLRQLVVDANDAISRTSLFSSSSGWTAIPDIQEDLVFIYRQCEKVLRYLFDTYENLPKDVIRRSWEKETLSQYSENVTGIRKKCEEMPKISQKTVVKIAPEIIEHAKRLLPWIYILALDETAVEMMAEENDRQYKILNNEHYLVVKIRRFGSSDALRGGHA